MDLTELTNTQKAIALNVAMLLECGIISAERVVEIFKRNKNNAQLIMQFWLTFDDMTRRALDIVRCELTREFLEDCYELHATDCPQQEK